MCSELKCLFVAAGICVVAACSQGRRLEKICSGEYAIGLAVDEAKRLQKVEAPRIKIDTVGGRDDGEPFIMNAVRDDETGEMVVTDVIRASTVTATFRNVAERAGWVSIGFDVRVPREMTLSKWKLEIRPLMTAMDEVEELDALYITGAAYREAQMRGYQRYNKFISSIVADTLDFVWRHQLEIFLKRNFPETYAAKTDSTFVTDEAAEDIFGVSQREAVIHYTMMWKVRANERRRLRKDEMYRKFVKDPFRSEGIRLDTVLTRPDGDFVYRYVHTFRSRPKLKKVDVRLEASLYEWGRCVAELPMGDGLTYYISSLCSLADLEERYRTVVLERVAYDNTNAYVDFEQGSAAVDTTLGENALELGRLVDCVDDIVGREEFLLDSLVITASCSPEGSYSYNAVLSKARSESIRAYISDFVPADWKAKIRTDILPENWGRLRRLIANDTQLGERSRNELLGMLPEDVLLSGSVADEVEGRISRHPAYIHLREKLYPKLRTVQFEFYLQRKGMVKDTVHTTELDSVYMAGVAALRELDYKKAVTLLRPYDDYNAALACMTADYNHTALDILERLSDGDARVCYLKAMALSRLGRRKEAEECFSRSVGLDPSMSHRANLDPEMYDLVKVNQESN